MNIERFLSNGRGANIIQWSVSLDDETVEEGCTEIVPGLHRKIVDWGEDVLKRAHTEKVKHLKKSGHVKNVSNIYTDEDAENGKVLEQDPCQVQASDAITQAHKWVAFGKMEHTLLTKIYRASMTDATSASSTAFLG